MFQKGASGHFGSPKDYGTYTVTSATLYWSKIVNRVSQIQWEETTLCVNTRKPHSLGAIAADQL